MNSVRSAMFCILAAVSFVSCASVAHYQGIDESVSRGDYAKGLDQLKAAKETAYKPNDKVLYYLDEGMLAHYSGAYKESSASLAEAERDIEAAFTKSVSVEVSSYLVNDTTLEYPGEDYEDIYLNVFNSLNYYHAGSIEDALVEIRRIDNKLKYISTKYGTAISNAQQAVLKQSNEIPYDAAAVNSNFTNSALARYLSMLFYRADGKRDDARIDRDQVKLAFAAQPAVYAFPAPSSLKDELDIPKGKARLNVVSFSGLSPVKEQNTLRIPMGGSHWIKIAVPVIVARPSEVAYSEVAIDDGPTFRLELIENLSAVAAETFKQKSGLIYLKTVLRSLTKTASSMVLDDSADDAGDSAGVLRLLSLGAQIYAEASEQADLRLSRYFPAQASVGGVTLDPGTYSYSVRYYDAANKVIHSARFENVEVRANDLNLSEAICIK